MESLSISPINLFLQAGPIGKFVMGALGLASLWCWVLIIEGVVSIVRLRRAIRAARAGTSAVGVQAIADAGRDAAEALTGGCSAQDRALIFGGTAAAFYGIAA